MSFRDSLLADPLFVVLTGRGMSRADAFDVCERAAYLQYMGDMSELEAIELANGSVPHEIRDALSKPHAPTPAKGKT